MLGLALAAALAVGAFFLIHKTKTRGPAGQSFFGSRRGLVLSVAIYVSALFLGGIGQFWPGLAVLILGGALGISLELSGRHDHKQSP